MCGLVSGAGLLQGAEGVRWLLFGEMVGGRYGGAVTGGASVVVRVILDSSAAVLACGDLMICRAVQSHRTVDIQSTVFG